MIVGGWATFLNLASVAVIAFACVIILTSIFQSTLCKKLSIFEFTARKYILWFAITSPCWIALLCVAIFWQTQQSTATNWWRDIAHWHHIDVFSLHSWHSIALILAACLVIWSVAYSFFSVNKHGTAMRSLLAFSKAQPHKDYPNESVYVIEHSIPEAFTAGLCNPKVYITSGLLKLDEKTVQIVVQHELAHLKARDPLFKTLFSLFGMPFPKRTRLNLQQAYASLTEQVADASATKYFDGLDVAQALVNVARFQRQQRTDYNNVHISHFSNDQITERIQTLLTPIARTPKILLIITIAIFVVTSLLTLSTVDSIHHFIETFFIH